MLGRSVWNGIGMMFERSTVAVKVVPTDRRSARKSRHLVCPFPWESSEAQSVYSCCKPSLVSGRMPWSVALMKSSAGGRHDVRAVSSGISEISCIQVVYAACKSWTEPSMFTDSESYDIKLFCDDSGTVDRGSALKEQDSSEELVWEGDVKTNVGLPAAALLGALFGASQQSPVTAFALNVGWVGRLTHCEQ